MSAEQSGNTKFDETGAPLLVSIGCLNVDFVCTLPALPVQGQRLMSNGIQRHLGGMAANVACAAAALGEPWPIDVELIAPIGTDSDADWVEAQLQSYGVTTGELDRDSSPNTCRCIILVEPNGERAIVSEPSRLRTAKLHRRISTRQEQHQRRHLHVDGFHAAAVIDTFREARQRGWQTSLDADELPDTYYQAARFEMFAEATDIIFINRSCADRLTGCSTIHSMTTALSQLAKRFDVTFLLTLGNDGVRAIMPQSNVVTVPPMTVDSIDSTGAGDVFAGVFLSCWLHGLSVTDAAARANVAGALSTRANGALGCLPTATQIERSLRT